MTGTKQESRVPPLAITAILHANLAAFALRTAVELDVFGPIERGIDSAPQIADEIGANGRGVELLLDALVGLDLINRQAGRYRLSAAASLYLVPSSPLFVGPYLLRHEEMMKVWAGLTEAIRTGKPAEEVNLETTAERFFPALASAIFPINYATAKMVAEKIAAAKLPADARVLDVAAGSGVWSLALAEANPGLTVDALDFPAVLDTTREFTEKYGVANRYRYLAGDWRDAELEAEAYDIVLLGHILHSEGMSESAKLLAKCRRAMKSGSLLVIAEFMPNEERSAPAMPLLFALNMYLLTTAGCVFTPGELERLLRSTGFSEIYRLELPFYGKESPVVVASRG